LQLRLALRLNRNSEGVEEISPAVAREPRRSAAKEGAREATPGSKSPCDSITFARSAASKASIAELHRLRKTTERKNLDCLKLQ
jgi:hypothetical protein